jgi:hypothetical protein
MKSSGGGSSSGSFPSGPSLTPQQKAARDRGEAANARDEAAKAREDARKAGADARRDEERAAADRRRGEYKFARQEMREARKDLGRERRDLARAARDRARAGRDQARARTAGLARPAGPGEWVLGGNDRYLTCAAAAVANSLLLATGIRVDDEDVLGLHLAAGGSLDAGASVLGVLEAAERYGLAEERPMFVDAPTCGNAVPDSCNRRSVGGRAPLVVEPGFSVCSPWPADRRSDGGGIEPAYLPASGVPAAPGNLTPSVILETALPGGLHAAVLDGGHLISWGRRLPVTRTFLDQHVIAAWAADWTGGRSVWPATAT